MYIFYLNVDIYSFGDIPYFTLNSFEKYSESLNPDNVDTLDTDLVPSSIRLSW